MSNVSEGVDMLKKLYFLGLSIILILMSMPILHSPDSSVMKQSEPHIIGQQDYWPTDEWRNSTPEEQGMNSTYLDQLNDYYTENQWLLRSMLIIRNGYIVFEDYPLWRILSDYPPYDPHSIWACSKIVPLALLGIAIENGNISSVHEPILNYFPNVTIDNPDPRKENITIEHLLTMTSGWEWDEVDDWHNYEKLNSTEKIQYVLSRPMEATPGAVWNHNSGAYNLIPVIINITMGIHPKDLTNTSILQPLGLNTVWNPDTNWDETYWSGLQATPRDMAKLYLLDLNNGTWDGEQLIPSEWVRNSTEAHVEGIEWEGSISDFGYIWCLKYGGHCPAIPNTAGSAVWIFPEHDLIFSTTYTINYDFEYVIRNFILPSVGVFDFMNPAANTTTTTETIQNFDMLVLGLGISGAVAAVVLIVYFYKRRV